MATYSFEISATCSTLKVSLHFRFLRYPYGVESAKVARKLQRPNAFDTAVQLANEFDDAVGEALEKAKAEDAAEAERVAKLSFADRELYAVEGLTNAIMKTASQLLERSNPTLTSNPHSMWSQLVRSLSAAMSVAFVRHMTCPGCQDFADCPDHGEGMITRGMSTLDSIASDVDVGHIPGETEYQRGRRETRAFSERLERDRAARGDISEEGLRTQTQDEAQAELFRRVHLLGTPSHDATRCGNCQSENVTIHNTPEYTPIRTHTGEVIGRRQEHVLSIECQDCGLWMPPR